MSKELIEITLVLSYVVFIYMDSFTIHARYAAVLENNIPMGITLHNTIGNMNRFVGVLIGPQIAFLVESNVDTKKIYLIGMLCFFCGGLATYFSFSRHRFIFSKLRGIVRDFSENGYRISTYFVAQKLPEVGNRYKTSGYSKKIIFAAAVISAGYYGSCYYLGVFSSEYIQYRATILQLAGVLTGFGTVILSIYLNPTLTELEVSGSYIEAYKSLMIGRILGTSVIPMLLLSLVFRWVN